MKINDYRWDEDNNVKFIMGNGNIDIGITVPNIKEFKDMIIETNNNSDKFIHITNDISINLEQVLYILY